MATVETVTRMLAQASIADIYTVSPDDNDAAKAFKATLAEAFKGAQEVKDGERVISLIGKDLRADIQTAKTKVEDKPFDAEYVNLSARTVEGAALLTDGIVDETIEKGEDDKEREKPSVVKYFNQGFGILARNACAARIRTAVEGPDKALMAAAKDLAKARGWTVEKALAKLKAMGD